MVLEGFTDADIAGDIDNKRSTSRYLITFVGGVVSWHYKLHKCVALFITKAEYITTTEAMKEMLWLKSFLQEMNLEHDEYVVYCDGQSALDLSKSTMYHSRTKHIDVRYHWLRDIVEENATKLE